MLSPHDIRKTTVAVIPAAGLGTRLGSAQPKAFVPLAGATILEHCLSGVFAAGLGRVVIAVPHSHLDHASTLAELSVTAWSRTDFAPRAHVITGGSDRTESVGRAIDFLASSTALQVLDLEAEPTHVLVHDAARCLTPAEVYGRVLDALASGAQNVVPTVPVVDTVRSVHEAAQEGPGEELSAPIDRSRLRAVQTPQGFAYPTLSKAHSAYERDRPAGVTDDSSLVERIGVPTQGVEGDHAGLKVTHPLYIRIAEIILTQRAGATESPSSEEAHVDAGDDVSQAYSGEVLHG